ncbi:YSC84-related protein [Pseudomonas sp. N040]|uniref:lipid-binding SYLF domain-containing protein n=1 Tax=Pseudomonas sp. N040 TaxID=2785325 RepID=UPI0018A29EE3|nr:lipid-binding SYLF domain-containing protein [Pseudomonas sp. N040]MBF7729433.1 lipid-binding SYLF domain-containing protein [Pseudomonas sp. N040]MBW7013073.1 lipid-binding SYLF domain-containing protein [Pseudomonas sp. N040]
MLKQFIHICGLLLAVTFASAGFAASNEECQATLKQFKGLGDTSKFIAESYGMAVLPTIGKAGIGLGGAYGEGCVYAGGARKGSVDMGQVTIGLQLGGQVYSQLILFKTKAAYDTFTKGGFEFGADATAVALTYGASAGAGTTGASAGAGETKGVARWVNDMVVFTLAKGGLMYEASIGGQKFDYTPD